MDLKKLIRIEDSVEDDFMEELSPERALEILHENGFKVEGPLEIGINGWNYPFAMEGAVPGDILEAYATEIGESKEDAAWLLGPGGYITTPEQYKEDSASAETDAGMGTTDHLIEQGKRIIKTPEYVIGVGYIKETE